MMKMRQHKGFRTYVWQIFNSGIALLITYLSGLQNENALLIMAVVIPVLNAGTKYINTRYFNDLGVDAQ